MRSNLKRQPAVGERDADAHGKVTLGDAVALSGEALLLRFGPTTPQQLVDLIVVAIRKGDDDEVAVIDRRLQEVEKLRNASLAAAVALRRED